MMEDFEPFYVVLYNSIAHTKHEIVSLPVSSNTTYIVEKSTLTDAEQRWEMVESTMLQNFQNDQGGDSAPFILWFDSGSVRPISMTLYRIRSSTSSNNFVDETRKLDKKEINIDAQKAFSIQNGLIEVHFDDG